MTARDAPAPSSWFTGTATTVNRDYADAVTEEPFPPSRRRVERA